MSVMLRMRTILMYHLRGRVSIFRLLAKWFEDVGRVVDHRRVTIRRKEIRMTSTQDPPSCLCRIPRVVDGRD